MRRIFLASKGLSTWRPRIPAWWSTVLLSKKTSNALMALLGGREIHPVNVRVGGLYKTPRRRDLATVAESLKRARDAALETVRWVAGFEFPDRERDYEFVALCPADEYPFNEGRIVSNKDLDNRRPRLRRLFRRRAGRAFDSLARAHSPARRVFGRPARALRA